MVADQQSLTIYPPVVSFAAIAARLRGVATKSLANPWSYQLVSYTTGVLIKGSR
jgi:hypothetical protein